MGQSAKQRDSFCWENWEMTKFSKHLHLAGIRHYSSALSSVDTRPSFHNPAFGRHLLFSDFHFLRSLCSPSCLSSGIDLSCQSYHLIKVRLCWKHNFSWLCHCLHKVWTGLRTTPGSECGHALNRDLEAPFLDGLCATSSQSYGTFLSFLFEVGWGPRRCGSRKTRD